MISDKQRELLESFIVDNEDLEELEKKLAEFNIFEAIGVVRQEIRHSNFLAFLLDPSQTHRLRDVFLKQFLKRVLLEKDNPIDTIRHADIDIADLTDAEVSREKHYIDILIHSPRHKLVCVIENKIYSGEHSNQLKKYEDTINRHYKGCQAIFIYLTPEGSPPSEPNWRIYNYYKVVEIIDSICISHKSTLGADIYTFMRHYSTLIRRHIVSDSEIAELCREIYFKHKQALDLIFEHRPDLQSKILSEKIDKLVKELLKPYIDSQKIFVDYYPGSIDFGPRDWENKFPKCSIYFKFDYRYDDVKVILQIGPINNNQNVRNNIFELAHNPKYSKLFKPTKKQINKDRITIYNLQILRKSNYEDVDIEDIRKEILDFWNDFIENDFVSIEKIISENIEMILNDN
ncbi:PD-(D/E)XK nuclease family protein [Anabaena catenula]|uniref:PD-(D/E)XK nuclease family protein n=1 Tax=Anabaena catenula FACHB-362 TaxID=2692877 RepID=A0ABR8IYM8_9NOST|nr:PD-(D/E)XK nuclease family protein [Anabaena catenula]MBD2690327.1 PD-(D/E)XK nuclease family protein [Anabaena catenula FACHB-362]